MEPEKEEEIGQIIKELNIEHIAEKAAKNLGWNDEEKQYALSWYARHWYLVKKYPDRHIAALSGKADDLWHQHILDIPKYMADSNRMIGKILEHQPIYGEPNENQLKVHEETEKLYLDEFNILAQDLVMTSGNYSYSLPWGV